jgi:hypothetical protein
VTLAYILLRMARLNYFSINLSPKETNTLSRFYLKDIHLEKNHFSLENKVNIFIAAPDIQL